VCMAKTCVQVLAVQETPPSRGTGCEGQYKHVDGKRGLAIQLAGPEAHSGTT
jgi:hypothetical protein